MASSLLLLIVRFCGHADLVYIVEIVHSDSQLNFTLVGAAYVLDMAQNMMLWRYYKSTSICKLFIQLTKQLLEPKSENSGPTLCFIWSEKIQFPFVESPKRGSRFWVCLWYTRHYSIRLTRCRRYFYSILYVCTVIGSA